jgi:hypothetical protein
MPLPADGELTLSFEHSIFYQTTEPVPAAKIAEALLALDRIVQRSPALLKRWVPGISKPKVQLLVARLDSGSLKEDIVVRFFFGSKTKMNRTIARIKKATGVDLNSKSGAVKALVLAALVYGAWYAMTHQDGRDAKPAIEISHNTIINIGAKELSLSAEDLVKLIEAAVPNKNKLAADAVTVIRPAKQDPNGEITVDGDQAMKITREFVRLTPEQFTAEKSEQTKVIEHAEVHLRAVDLDNSQRGWAAIVPAISTSRVALEIDDSIRGEDLFGSQIIHGTVEVVYRRDQAGQMQLRSYRLQVLDPAK